MIVACSSCGTRFSAEGYRDSHCPACGAFAQMAAQRPCPRCELPLAAKEISDLVVDECTKCNGVFLDHIAIKRVTEDRDLLRADCLLAALPRASLSLSASGRMYIKCPTCLNVMNRKLFATGSGVVIDVCREHGMFFDVGELPAIVDFVMEGGLERAAKKDAERKREQERRERQQQRVAAITSGTWSRDEHPARSNALVDLLFSLFD